MLVHESKAAHPRHPPMFNNPAYCCCEWLLRCWGRICDCFAAIALYVTRSSPIQRIIALITPSRGEKLSVAFCKRLTVLTPEKRDAEFDAVGQALFFSLNSRDKYILLSRLKIMGPEMRLAPYLQELSLEMEQQFSHALENGITNLRLDTDTTLVQDFLQNCLVDLLTKANASTAPAGFEKFALADQLQTIHYLYRIIYHSDLPLNDLYINQLLGKLPEAVRKDIAAKAKNTGIKELCLALIEHYIQPRESNTPQTIRQMSLSACFTPHREPALPSRGEQLVIAFCEKLNILTPEKRATEFYNIGQALLFSLNTSEQYLLLQKLKMMEPQTLFALYLQELAPEVQEQFNDALEQNVQAPCFTTDESRAQQFVQSCLFELLLNGNARVPTGFEQCTLVQQLQIIYFLYRVTHSQLQFTNRSDLYIGELLTKLPEPIRRDLATKANSAANKDLCLSLIENYIKPAASSNPRIVKETFFSLYEDVGSAAALESFTRLSRDDQRYILSIIDGIFMIDEKWLAAYHLAAFEKLSRDEQATILNDFTDEDLMEEYVDVAHPTIQERVKLLWERSSEPAFGLIVKKTLQILPVTY